MSTALALVAAKALPALSGRSLTYNPEKNVYLTLGYTSAAGNTYYKAIRLSDRLAVYYHIGEGYAHTFLNGIFRTVSMCLLMVSTLPLILPTALPRAIQIACRRFIWRVLFRNVVISCSFAQSVSA